MVAFLLKVKKTISGTMELHLPPIIVISVAAAAAILEDVDDEAPPPSRQGQESLEWQERTPTYLLPTSHPTVHASHES